MTRETDNYDLAGQVIGLAMAVHRELGPGFLENVYESSLAIELTSAGLPYERQKELSVYYKDQVVGHYAADLVVASELIVELKAVQELHQRHEVQLVHYLTATRIDHGLLFNFGAPSLQFKKKFRKGIPAEPNPNSVKFR